MNFPTNLSHFLCLLLLIQSALSDSGTVGINYGRIADNLPSPAQVVQLLKAQGITKVKLYDTDSAVLTAFSGSGISLIVALLKQTGSYPYPFFAYVANTDTISLDYALFSDNAGNKDSNNGLLYKNLFDAQIDAVFAAMSALGFDDVKVAISEIGWPSKGDENEVGASEENVAAYNGNLARRVLTGGGTPLRPNEPLNVYLFALFNEDLKPGATSERNYGLFYPNQQKVLDFSTCLRHCSDSLCGGAGLQSSATPLREKQKKERMKMVESSEEEDDFPSMESVTPQSKIDTIYQSKTEKGIRKICFELLDLKDAVENLCSNTRTKYLAFLRLSDEVVEMKHELNELQKHISSHGILIQDLMSGVCHELEEWTRAGGDVLEADDNSQTNETDGIFSTELEDRRMQFLEHVDVLLAEHNIEEAIDAIDAEERSHPELKGSGDSATDECSSFKSALSKRKAMLENQLIEISRQPSVGILELRKVLSGLLKLGKGPSAHHIFLKSYGSRLQRSIEDFLALCPCYPETYSATLSNLVFSMISLATKDSAQMFGDNPLYSNKILQWAEWEIESLVRLVKENAPPSETSSALRAASVFVQASLNHSSALEKQDLKLTKLLLVLLQPYIEEVLELNFRRARKVALDLVGSDESMPLSPRLASPLSTFATSSDRMLVDCGMRFIFAVKEIVEQLTRLVILNFGGNMLTRISQLFDKYVEVLIKSLTGTTEDDNLTDLKEPVPFKAETDSQQLALLGTAFTIAEELLPMVVSRIWNVLSESKEAGDDLTENVMPSVNSAVDPKEWRRQLQQSLDKLRDHFCRQYVLSFIYSRDGETRLDAQIYIGGKGKDLIWDSDPLPSLPFQALFGKLQQLAAVAGDVLLGKEKIQKVLLARLTETVVMWLSNEEEFWGVLEHDSAPLRPIGLQQLMLDMHFTVEIARFAGYPSRHLNKISSDIIARAVKAFSARGIDPQSSLPEDEWFVETAKGAINKLLMGGSGSDVSEIDEEDEHIIMDDEVVSDSDDSPSSLSSVESEESFASAQMEELESPVLTDSEN